MWKLVKTINLAGGADALADTRLEKAFNHWWPEFETRFAKIRDKHKTFKKAPERSVDNMVVEILEISRALQRNMESEQRVLGGTLFGGTSGLSLGTQPGTLVFEPLVKGKPSSRALEDENIYNLAKILMSQREKKAEEKPDAKVVEFAKKILSERQKKPEDKRKDKPKSGPST